MANPTSSDVNPAMILRCGSCPQIATAECKRSPKLCGSCCVPCCSMHSKDRRQGEPRAGQKRGQNSLFKRRRELYSWNIAPRTRQEILSNEELAGSLDRQRITPSAFVRRVLLHSLNRARALNRELVGASRCPSMQRAPMDLLAQHSCRTMGSNPNGFLRFQNQHSCRTMGSNRLAHL